MKKIIYLFIVVAVAWVSCDQENIGTLYETENVYVAFSSDAVPGNVLSAANNFSVKCQIVRSDVNTPTTATVELEMNDDINGVFTLENTSINFEDGKREAYVTIVPLVEPSLIDPTKIYVFKLTLTGNNVSPLFGTTTYKASFKYTLLGTGNFVSVFFEDQWPVEISKLEVGSKTLYKAKDLYDSGYDITFIAEGTTIVVNPQPAWYHSDYGDVYIKGSGTIAGKVISVELQHYVPDLGGWDPTTEVITLP